MLALFALLEMVIVTGQPARLLLFTTTTTYPVDKVVLSSSGDGVVVFVTFVLASFEVNTLNVALSPILTTVRLKLTFCPASADPMVLLAVTLTELTDSEIVGKVVVLFEVTVALVLLLEYP